MVNRGLLASVATRLERVRRTRHAATRLRERVRGALARLASAWDRARTAWVRALARVGARMRARQASAVPAWVRTELDRHAAAGEATRARWAGAPGPAGRPGGMVTLPVAGRRDADPYGAGVTRFGVAGSGMSFGPVGDGLDRIGIPDDASPEGARRGMSTNLIYIDETTHLTPALTNEIRRLAQTGRLDHLTTHTPKDHT